MLTYLRVKNLAIIDEEEIEFGSGLNVLSGETGAGKSIILGALALAMGDKPAKGLIRDTSKEALVEAIFTVNSRQKALLAGNDIEIDEDEIILQRKITPQRTIARVNGESVPSGMLGRISGILIDIYGQNEHQSLLSKKNHIVLLDDYAGEEIATIKESLSKGFDKYKELLKELDSCGMEEQDRLREIDLLTHEIAEIESAKLVEGEEEKLEEEHRKLSKMEKVISSVDEAVYAVGENTTENIGRAIRSLRGIESIDEKITPLINTLVDAEDILNDASHELNSYRESVSLSPERLLELSERLDLIDRLKRKYTRNGSVSDVLKTLVDNQNKLQRLSDYESYIKSLEEKLNMEKENLNNLAKDLTHIRKKTALELTGLINEALLDLNFTGSGIEISIDTRENIKRDGLDEVSFLISTNQGEIPKPIEDIASGGELSRIMLAIKTIFAGAGEIDTLVFDEIDSGVSGKTAARIAGRLSSLSKNNQVICITHLPQIAAKANLHFLIEKKIVDNSTISLIRLLDKDEHIQEVARMLAGDEITREAVENARILIT